MDYRQDQELICIKDYETFKSGIIFKKGLKYKVNINNRYFIMTNNDKHKCCFKSSDIDYQTSLINIPLLIEYFMGIEEHRIQKINKILIS